MTRLINIGRDYLKDIPKDAPVVSIRDAYTDGADIPNADSRPILRLSFFPGDALAGMDIDPERMFTVEKGEQLVAFCEEQRKAGADAIYIQCGEGRIRSYTLCSIVGTMEGYMHDRGESTFPQGTIDRVTARILNSIVDPIIRG